MNKNILNIEIPELTDEAVATLHDFIYEIMDAFETHYYNQLQRYHRHLTRIRFIEPTKVEDPPF